MAHAHHIAIWWLFMYIYIYFYIGTYTSYSLMVTCNVYIYVYILAHTHHLAVWWHVMYIHIWILSGWPNSGVSWGAAPGRAPRGSCSEAISAPGAEGWESPEMLGNILGAIDLVWLVVWNFFFAYIGNNHPHWLIFPEGFKPPTSREMSRKI